MLEDDGSGTNGGYAFISAVHGLLAADRITTRIDLVLAAATNALFEGDKTAPEVLRRVDQIWPGSRSSLADVETALSLGRDLGVLAQGRALDEQIVWTLTKDGVEDVKRHEEWVGGVRDRAIENLSRKASESLGSVSSRPAATASPARCPPPPGQSCDRTGSAESGQPPPTLR